MSDLVARSEAEELRAISAEARADLGALEEHSQIYERAQVAPSTRRLYRQRWAGFCDWCRSYELRPLPAHPDAVRLHLVWLAREGLSLSTIEVTLAAVRKAHKLAGLPPPASERLRDVLAGFRRTLGPQARHAEAISVAELLALVATCDATTVIGLRDRALLLVLYLLALRREELCALELADLRRDPEGYLVTIRRSKRDQAGEGRTLGLPVLQPMELCPVRALEAWLAVRELLSHVEGRRDPLFPSLRKESECSALSGRHIARRLQVHAEAAGFDVRRFRPHGLRAGFATSAARGGASLRALQDHLRHSDLGSTMRYVREGEALGVDNPARKLGRGGP